MRFVVAVCFVLFAGNGVQRTVNNSADGHAAPTVGHITLHTVACHDEVYTVHKK
jgi:hypothetical protein